MINEYKDIGRYCPIEQVEGRVKQISSILEKAHKKGIPIGEVEDRIVDIAGVRLICQFVEDIQTVVDIIKNREDMKFEDQCVELAKFHIRFLQIHPFYDGNGRVSRTILISQVHMLREQWIENPFTNKQRYYSAIELADNGNYQKLANIIKNGIEKY